MEAKIGKLMQQKNRLEENLRDSKASQNIDDKISKNVSIRETLTKTLDLDNKVNEAIKRVFEL